MDFDAERERYSPGKIYDAIRPVLVDLTQEIRRSLEFFRVQLGDIQPRWASSTGGEAASGGFPPCSRTCLGSTSSRQSLGGYPCGPKRFDPEKLRELGPEWMVPVGLALRGVNPLD